MSSPTAAACLYLPLLLDRNGLVRRGYLRPDIGRPLLPLATMDDPVPMRKFVNVTIGAAIAGIHLRLCDPSGSRRFCVARRCFGTVSIPAGPMSRSAFACPRRHGVFA